MSSFTSLPTRATPNTLREQTASSRNTTDTHHFAPVSARLGNKPMPMQIARTFARTTNGRGSFLRKRNETTTFDIWEEQAEKGVETSQDEEEINRILSAFSSSPSETTSQDEEEIRQILNAFSSSSSDSLAKKERSKKSVTFSSPLVRSPFRGPSKTSVQENDNTDKENGSKRQRTALNFTSSRSPLTTTAPSRDASYHRYTSQTPSRKPGSPITSAQNSGSIRAAKLMSGDRLNPSTSQRYRPAWNSSTSLSPEKRLPSARQPVLPSGVPNRSTSLIQTRTSLDNNLHNRSNPHRQHLSSTTPRSFERDLKNPGSFDSSSRRSFSPRDLAVTTPKSITGDSKVAFAEAMAEAERRFGSTSQPVQKPQVHEGPSTTKLENQLNTTKNSNYLCSINLKARAASEREIQLQVEQRARERQLKAKQDFPLLYGKISYQEYKRTRSSNSRSSEEPHTANPRSLLKTSRRTRSRHSHTGSSDYPNSTSSFLPSEFEVPASKSKSSSSGSLPEPVIKRKRDLGEGGAGPTKLTKCDQVTSLEFLVPRERHSIVDSTVSTTLSKKGASPLDLAPTSKDDAKPEARRTSCSQGSQVSVITRRSSLLVEESIRSLSALEIETEKTRCALLLSKNRRRSSTNHQGVLPTPHEPAQKPVHEIPTTLPDISKAEETTDKNRAANHPVDEPKMEQAFSVSSSDSSAPSEEPESSESEQETLESTVDLLEKSTESLRSVIPPPVVAKTLEVLDRELEAMIDNQDNSEEDVHNSPLPESSPGFEQSEIVEEDITNLLDNETKTDGFASLSETSDTSDNESSTLIESEMSTDEFSFSEPTSTELVLHHTNAKNAVSPPCLAGDLRMNIPARHQPTVHNVQNQNGSNTSWTRTIMFFSMICFFMRIVTDMVFAAQRTGTPGEMLNVEPWDFYKYVACDLVLSSVLLAGLFAIGWIR